MINVTELSISQLSEKIHSRELKCVDLVQQYAANIENKKNYNSIIYFNTNVFDEAAEMDKEADSGKFRGRLHGIPLIIKDNIHIRNMPNTAGTPALKDFIPIADSPVIQSLRNEGALFIAKANMHELAFGVTSNNATFGPCRNAHSFEHSAGGSSGGTGAAVALHMGAAGLGSDTGGSIRIPASVNGIFGLRPTLSRYSSMGVTPITTIRDTTGPMANHIEDLIILDEVITGQNYDVKQIYTSLKGLRIGLSSYLCDNVDSEIKDAFENAKNLLSDAGVEFVDVNLDKVKQYTDECGSILLFHGCKVHLSQYLKEYKIVPDNLEELCNLIASPDVKALFKNEILSDKISNENFMEAVNVVRPKLIDAFTEAFLKSNIQALMFPTLPVLPVRFDEINEPETLFSFIRNTNPGSCAGIPGLSIPMAKSKQGLPIGLEFDALHDNDHRLLSIGSLTQQILSGTKNKNE